MTLTQCFRQGRDLTESSGIASEEEGEGGFGLGLLGNGVRWRRRTTKSRGGRDQTGEPPRSREQDIAALARGSSCERYEVREATVGVQVPLLQSVSTLTYISELRG